uniref:Uncharacterized protein n=1 Tax=Picea glauca TaxID=3330 RepID=A0A117NFN4_PICGL|nr:hypothetical protein ABT39_MTgene2694 [Picea glauca]
MMDKAIFSCIASRKSYNQKKTKCPSRQAFFYISPTDIIPSFWAQFVSTKCFWGYTSTGRDFVAS